MNMKQILGVNVAVDLMRIPEDIRYFVVHQDSKTILKMMVNKENPLFNIGA